MMRTVVHLVDSTLPSRTAKKAHAATMMVWGEVMMISGISQGAFRIAPKTAATAATAIIIPLVVIRGSRMACPSGREGSLEVVISHCMADAILRTECKTPDGRRLGG
jgi:hypothetical protein